jgi:hypothetical protein
MTYGIQMIAINTHRDVFSQEPENYRHMYSYRYGVRVEHFFSGSKAMISTGILFISDQYLHTGEGAFGKSGQYCKVLTQVNPSYMGIPLEVGFGRATRNSRNWIRIGYRADLLQGLECNVIPVGNFDPKLPMPYELVKDDYNKFRHSLTLGLSVGKGMELLDQTVMVHVEPELSCQLTNDQSVKDMLSYRPVVLGVNTGISFVLKESQKIRKWKTNWKKRRDERRTKKQKEKERKKTERS